jgi:hypothetical protein
MKKRLPINPDSEDLFYNMADGLIFIKLLNLYEDGCVDPRTINKYHGNMKKVAITCNIN